MENIVRLVQEKFGAAIQRVDQMRGETSLVVDRASMIDVLTALKAAGFEMLDDLTAVDWLTLKNGPLNPKGERFSVVYFLLSLSKNLTLRVRVPVPEEDPELPTCVALWPGGNWMEREVFDMFGIRFKGHPELLRILMPADYKEFPMRKEFPLTKRPE